MATRVTRDMKKFAGSSRGAARSVTFKRAKAHRAGRRMDREAVHAILRGGEVEGFNPKTRFMTSHDVS